MSLLRSTDRQGILIRRFSLAGRRRDANFALLKKLSVILQNLAVMLMMGAMLGQTFSKSFLVLEYQWNKDFIARVLCVNRNKPEMKCEGKCYLCKKLKADAGKDRDNPERRMNNGSELFSLWTACQLAHPAFSMVTTRYPAYHERICTSCGYPPFIPPRAYSSLLS